MNDLQNEFERQPTRHIFYTDDLQVYLHIAKEKILEGIAQLADDARVVADWAGRSGLRFNAGKSKAILFGSRKNVNDINSMNLPGIRMQGGKPFHSVTKL